MFRGQTAVLFQKVIEHYAPDRTVTAKEGDDQYTKLGKGPADTIKQQITDTLKKVLGQ